MGRIAQFTNRAGDNSIYSEIMRDMPSDQLDRLIEAMATKGLGTAKVAHYLGMYPADVDAVLVRNVAPAQPKAPVD
jgi:hypothetical protein